MAAPPTAAATLPAAPPAPPSIHSRPLATGGGIWARVGFAFQDHTAAGFCLDMVADGSKLKAVWCEGQDDITLIWNGTGQDEVEFVQVKSDDPGRLWSAAILCERDSKVKKENRLGTSILEKSLACDRDFCEPRRFRLVTATPVNVELQPLTYPFDSPSRDKTDKKVLGLYKEAEDRVSDFKSERGNDFNFWLDNALVDIRHCEDSVRTANILALTKWVEKRAVWLLQDQIESLYTCLLHRVQEAAKCDPLVKPGDKKLLRDGLLTWLLEEARKIEHPGVTQAGERLRQKLQAAGIADSDIQAAAELRRYFRAEQLSPQYVGRQDQQRIEREVGARLLALRSRLDAGTILDNGVQFHATCVAEVQGLPAALGLVNPPDMSFLLGCMYNITDRCVHRFRGGSS